MKKRYAVLLLFLGMAIGTVLTGLAGAGENIVVFINGKLLNSVPGPRLIDGRVFVPLRAVSESMGASVGWGDNPSTAFIAGYDDPLTIDIIGPESFKKDMWDCIDLLREKDPEGYQLVGKYIKTITLDDYKQPSMESYRMYLHLPKDSYKTNTIWWAHTLVHEAKHAEQKYSVKNMTREEEEAEAGQRGLESLIKIGGSQRQINYVKEQLRKMDWWE